MDSGYPSLLGLAIATDAFRGLAFFLLRRADPAPHLMGWAVSAVLAGFSHLAVPLLGNHLGPATPTIATALQLGAALLLLRGTVQLLGTAWKSPWGLWAFAPILLSGLFLGVGWFHTGLALAAAAPLMVASLKLWRSPVISPGLVKSLAAGALVLTALSVGASPLLEGSAALQASQLSLTVFASAVLTTSLVGLQMCRAQRVPEEARIHRSRRLEGVALLAGGVAHDFNNLLTILKNIHHLLAMGELDSEGRSLLATADHVVLEASRLTEQLLAFGAKPNTADQISNVGAVLGPTVQLLERILQPRHLIVVATVDPKAWVPCAEGDLEQALINLVFNGRDAMPDGGTVTVDCRVVGEPKGAQVHLSVSDTGTGIRPEDRPKIFEPFFTTKKQGRGTGLGLSMVLATMSRCGGTVDVESELGRGTKFVLRFPLVAKGAQSKDFIDPSR